MPETITPTTPPDTKIAGKYDTPEAFDKGFREIAGKIGHEIPADMPLIAKDGKGLYASQEAAAFAYKGYESVMGKLTAKPATPTTPADPASFAIKEEATSIGDETIDTVLAKAGLKAEDITETWKAKGELTAAQYKALKDKTGQSRAIVDTLIRGMEAEATLQTQRVTAAATEAEKVAGGKEQLKTLREWALTGMDQARLARLNKQVAADPSFYPDMIALIAQAHTAAIGAGKAQPLIEGGGGGGSGPTFPKNAAEMNTLMRKVESGDADAIATLNKMPQKDIESLRS